MFYATWLRSVALISGSKLVYMWPFVWVWTSELARTQLLAKKKTKQNSEVDLKTVIESTFDFQIDKRNHFSTDEFISSLATATRKKIIINEIWLIRISVQFDVEFTSQVVSFSLLSLSRD